MAKATAPLYALNRGEVSILALMRADVERLRMSAEIQENFVPRVVGPMTLRPGTQYISTIAGSGAFRGIPLIYGATDTAIAEFVNNSLRILVNEAPITRASVATTVPTFPSWTLAAGTGTISTAGTNLAFSGCLQGTLASAYATVTVAAQDQATEHGLRIIVNTGPVTLRIGTVAGLDDIFQKFSLEQGTHSLAFTPNVGTVYIWIESANYALRTVNSVAIEGPGVMTLATPYSSGALATLSFERSGDVTYLADGVQQQKKIVRSGVNSYSLTIYQPNDGPFPGIAGYASVLISPSGYYGNISLTSNVPTFKTTDVGSLVRLFQIGQTTARTLAFADTYSDVIRVSGVSKVTPAGTTTTVAVPDRNFTYTIAGTWVGTLTLQRSVDAANSGFTDYLTFSANAGPVVVTDNLDNVVCWYRIGFKAGNYTSGSASVTLAYAGGGQTGTARVTGFTNSQTVGAEVINPFSSLGAASDWRMGSWSNTNGWPASPAIFEGRLWWAGLSRLTSSVSDAYESYDFDKVGDAGVIDRSIGRGPIQNIRWLLPAARLMAGGDTSIITARSNYFDEPLTPTVFTLKYSLTIGAAPTSAVQVDTSAIFIDVTGTKLFKSSYNPQKLDYDETDLTRLNPDIGLPGFARLDVQRTPDVRFHVARNDGQVAVLTYDEQDTVEAWWRVTTPGGIVLQTMVMPGVTEPRVYYGVQRVIGGRTVRYWERMARLDEVVGGTLNKTVDCHSVYIGAPTTTLTGLSYLLGQTVMVWADGAAVLNATGGLTFTVTGDSLTLPIAVSEAVVGIGYQGKFKSAKLAFAAQSGTAINKTKRVDHIGLVLTNTHPNAIQFGPDFNTLDSMPLIEDGAPVGGVVAQYDQQSIEFPGQWDADSRVCIVASSPYPATINGITIDLKTVG